MSDRNAVPIRDAVPGDRDAIIDYNIALALETEDKRLDRAVITRGVERGLADASRLRYWVADFGDGPVGQAAVTREWSDWRDGWVWWFQSVYVHPDHRGRGVFRSLYAHIRDQARSDPDVIGLRLYVEERNLSAQETYRAMGMAPGGYQVYEELWLAGR